MQLACYIVNVRVLRGGVEFLDVYMGFPPPPNPPPGYGKKEEDSFFWLKHQILKLWSLTVNVFPLLSVLDLFHLCQICKSVGGWWHRWRHILSSVFIAFLLYFRLRALSSGGSVTSPPLSPALPKYKLADYRYGREEMLALFLKDNKVSRKRRKVWCVVS